MPITEVHLEICYVEATPEEMIMRDRAYTVLGQLIYDLWMEKQAAIAAGKCDDENGEQTGC